MHGRHHHPRRAPLPRLCATSPAHSCLPARGLRPWRLLCGWTGTLKRLGDLLYSEADVHPETFSKGGSWIGNDDELAELIAMPELATAEWKEVLRQVGVPDRAAGRLA